MKKIPLTQGKFALVDDSDFKWLNQWKWFALKTRHTYYAARSLHMSSGTTRPIYMHREITKPLGGLMVDHISRDGLDNRKCNLRQATGTQNQANRGRIKNSKSGYKGVTWNKIHNKWHTKIGHKGKTIWIGRFSCLIKAARAYDIAAIKYYGDFAGLNFPEKS
jgi:hypothetical protein